MNPRDDNAAAAIIKREIITASDETPILTRDDTVGGLAMLRPQRDLSHGLRTANGKEPNIERGTYKAYLPPATLRRAFSIAFP